MPREPGQKEVNMSARHRLSRPLLIAVPIIGVLLLTVGLLFVFVPRGPDLPKHSSDFSYAKIDPPQTAPEFTLRDQFGKIVRLSDFEGETVVLAFWYTSCTHSCQITAYTVALLPGLVEKRLPDVADDIKFLAVTIDPERDTQEQRKRFVDTYVTRHGGSLLFLGGDGGELAQVWEDYGITVVKSSTSEFMRERNLTEEELIAQITTELEDSIHGGLPPEIKTDLMNNIHVAIAKDYFIAHQDVIFIIKDGKLRYKIFGHEINPESFAQLLAYVKKS